MKLICPECKEEVVKIYQVGWAHKPFSTCTLDDGLNRIVYEDPDTREQFYGYHIKDIKIRAFFVHKFNLMEKEAQEGGLNKEIIEVDKNTIIVSEKSAIDEVKEHIVQIRQRKAFLKVFEPYYEEGV